jgi:hypothetical protein
MNSSLFPYDLVIFFSLSQSSSLHLVPIPRLFSFQSIFDDQPPTPEAIPRADSLTPLSPEEKLERDRKRNSTTFLSEDGPQALLGLQGRKLSRSSSCTFNPVAVSSPSLADASGCPVILCLYSFQRRGRIRKRQRHSRRRRDQLACLGRGTPARARGLCRTDHTCLGSVGFDASADTDLVPATLDSVNVSADCYPCASLPPYAFSFFSFFPPGLLFLDSSLSISQRRLDLDRTHALYTLLLPPSLLSA